MIRGMTPAEAFSLACTPSLVGISLLGGGEPGERAERLAAIERGLTANGKAMPPEPTDAAGFSGWRNAILAAVLEASGQEQAAHALFGVYVGDALLFATLLSRALSPGPFAGELAAFRAEVEATRGRLATLVGTPLATPVVRRIGGEILAVLPAVRDATDAAVARAHTGKLDTLRLAVEAALALAASRA